MNTVNLDIDFADSEYKEMYYSKFNLIIKITSWEERTIDVIFFNAITFNYFARDFISDIYESTDNDLFLLQSLRSYYSSEIPVNHNFKKYSILDINDLPIFEIVAEHITASKSKC